MMTTTFDKLAGVLVGAATADALGAGYEFGPTLPSSTPVVMRAQGRFEAGEWTDDTAQLLAIAMAAADGADLATPAGEDAVAANFQDWYLSPARLKDIGIHSSEVFGAVATQPADGLAARFRAAAQAKEAARPGSSGGNGAVMRTAAVAMALHHDPQRMVEVALRLGSMTHDDQRSSEACAVWCLAIMSALHWGVEWDGGEVEDLGAALDRSIGRHLPDSAQFWHDTLVAAHRRQPADFHGGRPTNGYSVTAVQAAWAAMTSTPIPADQPALHLRRAIESAVRGGGDTDTVACIAGALLGAMWGYSAVPLEWRRRVFGWPGLRDADLLRIADAIHRDSVDPTQWPHAAHVSYDGYAHADSLAVHPHDDGIVLSGASAAYGRLAIPGGPVDAVVSLCRVGREDLSALGIADEDHIEVRLIDRDRAADNPNLGLVMNDAADTVAALRRQGRRVLLHCVAAQSRTPSVAALYSVRHRGIDPRQALSDVVDALPAASPNAAFRRVVLEANVRPL